MVKRIVTLLIGLSMVYACAVQDEAPKHSSHTPIRLPTPERSQALVVFENGDYCLVDVGQRYAVSGQEHLRTVVGEDVTVKFTGQTTCGLTYSVERREAQK